MECAYYFASWNGLGVKRRNPTGSRHECRGIYAAEIRDYTRFRSPCEMRF
jgi:hypothetical protein